MNKERIPVNEYTLTNGTYNIRYVLLEERVMEGHEPPRPSFSLTVKRGTECATIADFTHKREKALPLLDLFCKEEVLPEELPHLAEDLLADFDFVE